MADKKEKKREFRIIFAVLVILLARIVPALSRLFRTNCDVFCCVFFVQLDFVIFIDIIASLLQL